VLFVFPGALRGGGGGGVTIAMKIKIRRTGCEEEEGKE
jgi:hypothetical protein